MKTIQLTGILLLVAMTAWTGAVVANNSGVAGKSRSANGCNCHGNSPNVNFVVAMTLSGPHALRPGTTGHYTLSVTDSSGGTTGGFDMSTNAGTFVPDTSSKVLTGDLVHFKNKWRSWPFGWTAPAAEGVDSLFTIAMTSNGGGASGDSWDWYGGAPSTPFLILVAASVGVDDAASGLSLSTAQPSPFHGTTRLAFTLPKPGPARLEVVDLQGRRVATLMQGSLDAGFHQVVWFGRGDNGQNVRGGVYFVRLQAQGRTLVERVTKLD